jgi:hypothetical protein
VIVGTTLLLPFMVLEIANRRRFHEDFPVVLFGVLWLMPVVFVLILLPTMRILKAASRSVVGTVSLLAGIALLLVIAWLWISIILDQMPCFLGVTNCD